MRSLALIVTGIAACLSFATASFGKTSSHTIYGTTALVTGINHTILSMNPNAHIGIAIKSMKYGDTIYTKNERTLFVPASTLKVFTAEAALLFLGPNFKFPTRFVTDATSINNGTLNGNLYLVNSGDPTLTYYDVADLMTNLKSQRIQEITGNVYIDNTAYDQATTGPGWLWNDKKYCYGAPISASIINHNCLSFKVTPAKYSGIAAHITTDPRLYYASIRNGIVTRSHGGRRSCYVKLDGAEGGAISVSGCMAKGHGSAGVTTVIHDVLQYDKSLLQDLFRRAGIRVRGGITAGAASPESTELARHESKPLRQLISDMLKMSDNIIAGSLFKKIGEMYTHRPGTWESGSTAVSQILSKNADVDVWRLSLIDGSGLSRYNQVTPAQMLQVLDFAYHDSTNFDFISALPVAGVDGTLKRRMKNIAWRVRAKTGTIAGVVSLAGYAVSADKEPFAFVIMINGRNGSVWQYRELEDKVLTMLTHYSRQA